MLQHAATSKNATTAARTTGSRGRPAILPPPFPPALGILILIATVLMMCREKDPLNSDDGTQQKVCIPARTTSPVSDSQNPIFRAGFCLYCTAPGTNERDPRSPRVPKLST